MKKVVSYILFLGLAVVLLYFSFSGVHWNDFIEGLRSANYTWILASMTFGVVAFWIRGIRWRLLIQNTGYRVTKSAAFDAITIAYLANFALPRAGELARCGVLTKTSRAPFDTLLGTVVLERAFDVLCLFITTMVVIGVQWNLFGSFMERQLWDPFLAMFAHNAFYLAAFLLFIALVPIVVYLYRKRLNRFFVFQKTFEVAAGIFRGLKSGYNLPQKGAFLLYTLVLWGCYLAMSYCTLLAFPAVSHLNILDAAFLMAVGSLGWIVPVQGGIGAYHFIVSLALASVYGISQTQGFIFATISHESQAITMILFGLFSLIRTTCRPQAQPNR